MKILLVEDDPQLREAITDTLEIKRVAVVQSGNGREALTLLQQQTESPDLILSDINMPEMDGLQLLDAVRERHPWLPFVLMTAFGDVSQAVLAMQRGANDYLTKPFDLVELDNLLSPFDVRAKGRSSARRKQAPVCEAPASRRLFDLAERVAATDSTVLISGESGTGKEVLARYIHEHSPRADQPFVAINCAAIPENMLEAMLFGYEKGAYTGAHTAMPGKFEQAQGGTLLLDEVTEMDMGLQAKLLRVLQERQVERLGSKKTLQLDVRIIATTNRELVDYVAQGDFREDLYYRLSVFPLQWLPLRDRKEDILPLAKRLLAHHAGKMKRPVPQLAPEAEARLLAHCWPGNVRELDNTLQRALIVQTGPRLFARDLILTPVPGQPRASTHSPSILETTAQPAYPVAADEPGLQGSMTESDNQIGDSDMNDDAGLGKDLKHREAQLIVKALREEPSRKDAADRLGISPRTLRYKVARLKSEGVDIDALMQAS